jgi:hypothetical protein
MTIEEHVPNDEAARVVLELVGRLHVGGFDMVRELLDELATPRAGVDVVPMYERLVELVANATWFLHLAIELAVQEHPESTFEDLMRAMSATLPTFTWKLEQ